MPDNAIVLEGMTALYLSSERATDLRAQQIDAVLAWVRTGGHLIVAIDQVGDVGANRWLKEVLPVTVSGTTQMKPAINWRNGCAPPWSGRCDIAELNAAASPITTKTSK